VCKRDQQQEALSPQLPDMISHCQVMAVFRRGSLSPIEGHDPCYRKFSNASLRSCVFMT